VPTLQNIQNLAASDEIKPCFGSGPSDTQAIIAPPNLDLYRPRSTAAAAAAAAHFLFRSLELAQEEVTPCFSTKDH
jgi:hypothetical protein